MAFLIGGVAVVWVRGLTVRPVRMSPAAGRNVSAPEGIQKGFSERNPDLKTAQAPVSSRYPDWGGNPFLVDHSISSESGSGAPAGYAVSGILWDPQVPSAVVNGRIVVVGDTLDQWKVVGIQRDRVILSDGADTQTITVK